jgi:hypothetical protein
MVAPLVPMDEPANSDALRLVTCVLLATTSGGVPLANVEVICPVALMVVKAPVLAVVPPIGPGEGKLTVEPPRLTEVPPIAIVELANLPLAIDPASIVLVTVPVSPDPTKVPSVAGMMVPLADERLDNVATEVFTKVPPGTVVVWLSPVGCIVQAVVGAMNVILLIVLEKVFAPENVLVPLRNGTVAPLTPVFATAAVPKAVPLVFVHTIDVEPDVVQSPLRFPVWITVVADHTAKLPTVGVPVFDTLPPPGGVAQDIAPADVSCRNCVPLALPFKAVQALPLQ